MARALLPVKTTSAHWIAHPEFRRAIANFLNREEQGIDNYMEALHSRSPLRASPVNP
jgi:predicted N-acyltransferase